MKFIIKGDNGDVIVEIIRRNDYGSEEYYDANWLSTRINVNILGYNASFNGDIQTTEIESFMNQVEKMYNMSSNEAIFSTIEGIIEIKGKKNTLGHIEWICETRYPAGIGATLLFSINSDQSFLPNLISQLKNILKIFPVINANK